MDNQNVIIDQRPTTNPLLSVIIVSYNEAEYLPEAIESVLSQNFDDFEIIIGDDGSSDNSHEVIESFKRLYPGKINSFVMERPEDDRDIIPSIRVSNVIKTALTRARGKFISLLSGDDYFCNNNKFSDAVKFLNSHNEYSAYISSFKRVYPNGNEDNIYAFRCPRSVFWSGIYIHIASFIFRKSVYDEGYFINRLCDDTGLIFSTACAGKWKFTEDITFAYRQRENSIMHRHNKLELMVLELMLFQDCLCAEKMRWSSYSRFYRPLRYVYRNRESLNASSYEKFIMSCEKYDNNVLGAILNYDTNSESRRFIRWLTVKGKLANLFFKCARKFYRLPFRIIRKCRKILSRS